MSRAAIPMLRMVVRLTSRNVTFIIGDISKPEDVSNALKKVGPLRRPLDAS